MNSITRHIPYILQNVDRFKHQKVLIIGDVGVDEYVMGGVKRISPEAPVPVVDVETEETRLGLAANVAQNVASLGGEPIMVAVVGNDATSEQLRQLLRANQLSSDHLVIDKDRPTTRKLRVMSGNHHICRVDYERRMYLSLDIEKAVIERVQAAINGVCAVIIQDYAKGVISEGLVQDVVRLARAAGKRVLVDPYRTTPVKYYRGADLMTPNYDESMALAGESLDDLRLDPEHLNRVGKTLMDAIQSTNMVITRGKDGLRLFSEGRIADLPTFAKQVFDVTGAGDTVIAALALAWGSGFPLDHACALANFAAGVVVGKVGCVPCTKIELLEYIHKHEAI